MKRSRTNNAIEPLYADGKRDLDWAGLVVGPRLARAQLETKKVKFDGEIQTIEGMVALATFFDPDGNQLMLAQHLSGGQP